MKALKLVLIGGGDRARDAVYPAFGHVRDQGKVEIAGICHTNPQRRGEFAAAYGIEKTYGQDGAYDYQKMIREIKPQAAVIIGQPNIMFDSWVWCLKEGIHLFIEKPPGLSIHQARVLAALAERNNAVTQVAFQRRYTPLVKFLRDECLKRGHMTQALCKIYKYGPQDCLLARDRMMDDAIHVIDTLRWLAGSEAVRVESMTRRAGAIDINLISAQIEFENGCIGQMLCNWASGKRIFSVEMHAPGIFVEAEHEGKGLMYTGGNLVPQVFEAPQVAGSELFWVYTGVLAMVEDFVDCCLAAGEPSGPRRPAGRRPQCSFRDAVHTMKLAEVILAQSLLREGL
ncbi:MAG: Gfo/Idh/MocA family oxidoreductase [Spirochaetaceae bacterium]|jgi:predicted dehydrogenase|nr:Gfo/Idh/MocA family oxidoreductase [Spirochaetaceae bacterium]